MMSMWLARMEALFDNIGYFLVKGRIIALFSVSDHWGKYLPGIGPFPGFVTAAYLAVYHGGTQASLGRIVSGGYRFVQQKSE